MSFLAKYGPWALVTGAGAGLGQEFARQSAVRGLNVVLVDINQSTMTRVADDIKWRTGRTPKMIVVDLSQPQFIETIRAETAGLEIGLLVNNAGISSVGPFIEQRPEDNLRAVAVNVQAPLILTHEFGPRMVARGRGGIIFLSSMAGLQGTAYVTTYAATKAFNLILAEGLWQELGAHGVDVLGFLPGSTRTPGFLESQPQVDRARLSVMEAPPTVAEALDALGKRPRHVAGPGNRLVTALLQRCLPRRQVIKLIARSMADLYERR